MKLNLVLEKTQEISGYINVNPFTLEENDSVKSCSLYDLSPLVAECEATEILAINVLDYLDIHKVKSTLDHWISRLRHGGKIVIGGTDMYAVCKSFTNYNIDINEVNSLLHGEQTGPHLIKRVNLTVHGLAKHMSQQGLNILRKQLNGFNMVVEAVRP